ncbi:FecR family protein [Sphingobacterium suaedae]|uniref:FecR family protein n=1 Tax=Sphingobacterium suaedae TaxID=1686402 RepID=A0ABW5KH04_9SPHI
MQTDKFQFLYQKYLKGQCTPSEFEAFKLYFLQSAEPHHLHAIEEIDALLDQELLLDKHRSDKMLVTILATRRRKKTRPLRMYMKYIAAACALLIVSLGVHYYQYTRIKLPIYKNCSSAVQRFALPDGTTVYLRPNATLEQLTSFMGNDSIRSVRLAGEGFFSVYKNKQQPFIVHALNGLSVRVLGTRFHADFREQETSVVLTEGSILVNAAQHQVNLRPEDRLTYDEKTGKLQVQKVDTLLYTAWIDHQLYFNDQTLDRVLQRLQEAYPDEQLRLRSSYQTLKFTGYLPTNDLNRAIEILQRTFANHNLTIIKYE